MRSLSWSVIIAGLIPLLSCIGNDQQSLSEKWQDIKARANFADYCDMEVCDDVEQGAQPPCDCWCDYDGDDDGGAGGDDTGDGDTGDCDTGNDDVCGGGDDGSTGGDDGSTGGDDTGGDDTGDDDGTVEGCTLTQGYWKNHNEFQTNRSQAIDWPAPMDELDQLCGQTLLDILGTSPRGEAWIILAHQYIAASLNAAAGASTGGGVADALDEAGSLLTGSCGGISGADRDRAIELSELLDGYNNGLLGPAHCN